MKIFGEKEPYLHVRDEIINKIFSYLSKSELNKIRLVNKDWNKFYNTNTAKNYKDIKTQAGDTFSINSENNLSTHVNLDDIEIQLTILKDQQDSIDKQFMAGDSTAELEKEYENIVKKINQLENQLTFLKNKQEIKLDDSFKSVSLVHSYHNLFEKFLPKKGIEFYSIKCKELIDKGDYENPRNLYIRGIYESYTALINLNDKKYYQDIINYFTELANLNIISLSDNTNNIQDIGDKILEAFIFYNAAIKINEKDKTVTSQQLESYLIKKIEAAELLFLEKIGEYVSKTEYINFRDQHKSQWLAIKQEIGNNLKNIEIIKINSLDDHEAFYSKACEINNIYKICAIKIKSYLEKLINDCKSIIGETKCKHSFLCFGSLSKQSATPYSDIELGILIDEEQATTENKNYFRILSYLLAFKIVNLRQTLIPFDIFKSEITPGISFDDLLSPGFQLDLGGKTPIGRKNRAYDLINTPSGMAGYLKDEYFKIDKFLPIELMSYDHICGDEEVTIKFHKEVTNFLNQDNNNKKIYEIRALNILAEGYAGLQGDVEKYNIHIDEASEESKLYTVKQEIYRLPDRLIDGLALYFGINNGSTWEKIDQLKEKEIITDEKAIKYLKTITGIANELRLKTYLKNEGQVEKLSIAKHSEISKKDVKEFYQIDNLNYMFHYYFIAFPLHESVKKFCNLALRNEESLNDEEYLNLALALSKNEDPNKNFIQARNFYLCNDKIKGFIYKRIANYKLAENHLEEWCYDAKDDINTLLHLTNLKCLNGKYIEAVIYLSPTLHRLKNEINNIFSNNKSEIKNIDDIATINKLFSVLNSLLSILYKSKDYESIDEILLEYFQILLKIFPIVSSKQLLDSCYDFIILAGNICYNIEQYHLALKLFSFAEQIYENSYDKRKNNITFLKLMNGLCKVLNITDTYDNAIILSKKSLDLFEQIYDKQPTLDICEALINISDTLSKTKNYEDALTALYKAEADCHSMFDEIPHVLSAKIKYKIANIYLKMNSYTLAFSYCENACKIYKEISINDSNISLKELLEYYQLLADMQCSLAFSLNHKEDQINQLYKSLETYQVTLNLVDLKKYKDYFIFTKVEIKKRCGDILFYLGKYNECIEEYKRGLEFLSSFIKQDIEFVLQRKISLNDRIDLAKHNLKVLGNKNIAKNLTLIEYNQELLYAHTESDGFNFLVLSETILSDLNILEVNYLNCLALCYLTVACMLKQNNKPNLLAIDKVKLIFADILNEQSSAKLHCDYILFLFNISKFDEAIAYLEKVLAESSTNNLLLNYDMHLNKIFDEPLRDFTERTGLEISIKLFAYYYLIQCGLQIGDKNLVNIYIEKITNYCDSKIEDKELAEILLNSILTSTSLNINNRLTKL